MEIDSHLAKELASADPADAQFRLLVESVTDYAIYLLDPAGRVMSWNAGAERILGYKLDFSPPVVDVRPGTTVNVACSLVVPSDTKRARYFGVIEAAGTPGLQLLVSLNVI